MSAQHSLDQDLLAYPITVEPTVIRDYKKTHKFLISHLKHQINRQEDDIVHATSPSPRASRVLLWFTQVGQQVQVETKL